MTPGKMPGEAASGQEHAGGFIEDAVGEIDLEGAGS
jgi:hypothetical protein